MNVVLWRIDSSGHQRAYTCVKGESGISKPRKCEYINGTKRVKLTKIISDLTMQMAVENIVGKGDKRTKMALDCSPDFLRRHSTIFLVGFREEFLYVRTVLLDPIH